MKEYPKQRESKMNDIFGRRYIQNCIWIPWSVLIILIIGTRLENQIKWATWFLACLFVGLNIIYITLRLCLYILDKKRKQKNEEAKR